MKFPPLVRAAVLGINVLAVVVAFATYTPEDVGPLRPQPNVIANTWYGPLLVVLIPIVLGWMCFAIERKWLRILTLGITGLLLLGCVSWIYAVRDIVGTLPYFLR